MASSRNLNQCFFECRVLLVLLNNVPRNGMQKAKIAARPRLLATRPVVFTARVALPAPFTGMLSEDGLIVQEGDDVELGRTEQLKLTESVKPFNVLSVIAATPWVPTDILPSDAGDTVIVKSGCGGGALLGKKI